jgi:hypothetical protein
MPHTAKIADELCFIKSMNTDAINHDPAIKPSFRPASACQGFGRMSWPAVRTGLPAFVACRQGSAISRSRRGQRLPADAVPRRDSAPGRSVLYL